MCKYFGPFLISYLLLIAFLSDSYAQQDSVMNGLKTFYYSSGQKSSEGYMLNGKPEGIWKNYYKSGALRSVGKRTNHLLDSTWVFYNADAQISAVINYQSGKKHGPKLSYENDKLVLEEQYAEDLKVGEERAYFKNETLKSLAFYANSKLQGNFFAYDSTGVLQELGTYEQGVITRMRKVNRKDKRGLKQGLWIVLYENQMIKQEMNYKDNLLDGYLKYFNQIGEIEKVERYVNGVLIEDPKANNNLRMAKTYYPDATVKTFGAFDQDKPIGLHLEYDSQGKIIQSKLFEQGKLIAQGLTDAQNRKQGFWKEFYEDGSLKAEGEYEDDLKIKAWKYFYANGNKEQFGNYANGKPTGKWQCFYENGQLLREEEYRNGLEDGFAVEFTITGDTLSYGEFLDGEKEGIWIIESGAIKMSGGYKSGLKDGNWIYRFEDGKQRFTGNYVQGFPNGKHTYFFESGKIQQEGKYSMGKKEGDWRKYDENGLLIFTVTYKDGIEIKYEGVKIKPGFTAEDYEFIVEDIHF